jgi:hypothetical protein
MRIYIKKDIYFNVMVSQYFDVPFNNPGEKINLIAYTVLFCPIVTWDIDTKKTLSELGNQEISLLGKGSGNWEIYADQVVQNKPDTAKWNNTQEEDPQTENGRSASKNLDEFIKGVNMLFI